MYDRISGFADEIDSSTTIQFEVLNKLGIKYFEPRGIDGKNISELSDEEVLILKEKMDKYGIKASSIGSPIGKIKLSDDFEAHYELYKRIVKIAKFLGSKYIRIFSFYGDGEEWTECDRDMIIANLTRMIDYAKEEGVVLLHENEKDIYGDTVERCRDLMEALSCENFRAVFDPANFVQCGQDTKKAYEVLSDYIEYMHIKDALYKDNSIVPPGEGDGNIPFVLGNLFKKGYDGYISLEPHLGTFEGLAQLELSDEMLSLPKGGEGTFSLAFNSLCKIIEEVK